MSSQKEKGTRFETQVVSYLRENGMKASRQPLHGSADRGDVLCDFARLDMVVECKNRKSMSPGWLMGLVDEAGAERDNANASFGIGVCHRDGCGEGNMGKSIVVMELDTLLDIWRVAR